jgi:hypothetical protein
MRTIILSLVIVLLCSCTIYTEKRSEALSQAVFATADSVQVARFDLADKYSKEATRLAFPPKKAIKISPIVTKPSVKPTVNVETPKPNVSIKPNSSSNTLFTTPISNTPPSLLLDPANSVIRLVIPEKFKDYPLLIENSTEWNDLIKTKEFSKQLEKDIQNLYLLKKGVDEELARQNEMNSKMVKDLNIMQKKLVEKDLAILQRNVVIVSLLLIMAAALYLRIKGIL